MNYHQEVFGWLGGGNKTQFAFLDDCDHPLEKGRSSTKDYCLRWSVLVTYGPVQFLPYLILNTHVCM